MSISIEALAMAGADYIECNIDFKEWERWQMTEPPPPHLYADEDDEVTRFVETTYDYPPVTPSLSNFGDRSQVSHTKTNNVPRSSSDGGYGDKFLGGRKALLSSGISKFYPKQIH